MAYGDFNDLTRRTASDRIFLDKVFDIAKNPSPVKVARYLNKRNNN